MKLLLGTLDIEADARDESDVTPLSLAAENEHVGIVKLFLERPDVETDSEDLMNNTSLTWAANRYSWAQRHWAVKKLLTDRIATVSGLIQSLTSKESQLFKRPGSHGSGVKHTFP